MTTLLSSDATTLDCSVYEVSVENVVSLACRVTWPVLKLDTSMISSKVNISLVELRSNVNPTSSGPLTSNDTVLVLSGEEEGTDMIALPKESENANDDMAKNVSFSFVAKSLLSVSANRSSLHSVIRHTVKSRQLKVLHDNV